MKKTNLTYRFISLTMAFLIFCSSAGFSMDMHFCQGKFKSFSILGKAKNCHEMAEAKKSCPHHQAKMEANKSCSPEMEKGDCCSNKTYHFQSDQDKTFAPSDIIFQKELKEFIVAFVTVFLQNEFSETEQPQFTHYTPPIISRDIYVLFETFLI